MKPKNITEYINSAPSEARKNLRQMKRILKSVAPKATEAIKWGYPILEQERILFSFSGFKTHINFMPTRSTLKQFKKELTGYKLGKDTIQFPNDKPLPTSLIQKIAKYRIQEVKDGALWMWK